MNINLTNPGIQPPWFQSKKSSIVYKESVIASLTSIGVPLKIAEIAVIDLKFKVTTGYHRKQTSKETALLMIDMINRIYKYEDGTWH